MSYPAAYEVENVEPLTPEDWAALNELLSVVDRASEYALLADARKALADLRPSGGTWAWSPVGGLAVRMGDCE